MSLGVHTFQIEGISASGIESALRVPVDVVASEHGELPATGLERSPIVPIGLSLLALGSLFVIERRRRRDWGPTHRLR
jgi:LPXTG-motif cell wall-anchored protein